MNVIVVGAGLSGLTCARDLANRGHSVSILEKSRGVGGRMATRRLDGMVFDHGAQFFTVRDPAFAEAVNEWRKRNVVSVWTRGFPTEVDGTDRDVSDGHPRYFAPAGMTGIAKRLAAELDIRLEVRVAAVDTDTGTRRVRIRDESAQEFSADACVITAPVPQALALLRAGRVGMPQAVENELSAVSYEPCLAVLSWGGDGADAWRLPAPGAIQPSSGAVRFVADNQRKGVSPLGPAVTVHMDGTFSADHYEEPDHRVIELAKAELGRAVQLPRGAQYQVKRWRYARPRETVDRGAYLVSEQPSVVLAGDAFAGAKLEGAFLSGQAAAQLISFAQ